MNRYGKMILASALIACTVITASCASGNGGGNAEKNTPSPKATDAGKHTAGATSGPQQTPAGSTMNPAVSEIPAGADKWINACENAESVLMNKEQIQKMNAEIRSKCPALTDIASYPASMSKSALTSLIEGSSGPSIPKYDEDGTEITVADMSAIKDNRNLGALEETVSFKKGVTVQRTDCLLYTSRCV